MRSQVLLAALIVVVCSLIGGASLSPAPPIADAQSVDGSGQILVKFRPGTPGQAMAAAHAKSGAQVESHLQAIGVDVLEVPPGQEQAAIADYEKNPNVLYAEINGTYKAIGTSDDTQIAQQWQYNNVGQTGGQVDADIDAFEAWDVTSGSPSIKIAIVDTGIDQSHEDLASKIVANVNFSAASSVDDIFGHGTHVAGTAAAITDNALGVAGTCPDCVLMNVKVLNDDGSGNWDDVAAGIIWAADNGADVINMSIGDREVSSTVEDAVDYAWAQGAVLVAAAGNDGVSDYFYPAAYDNVIAVGATDQNDTKASFSEYGPWVDVAAPGDGILSTAPDHFNVLWLLPVKYATASGTSMASPHVAGIAGLIWSTGLCSDNVCVRDRIEQRADVIPGTGTYWTYGRVNAYSSVVAGPPPPQLPIVTGVSPASGVPEGGTAVTVSGLRFSTSPGGTAVHFGATDGSNVSCPSTTSCTATSPAGTGSVHVTVTADGLTSTTSSADIFTFAYPFAGYWALDDGSGPVAADSSGNGYDGALVNGPTWRTGRVGGALSFDGNDDRVDLPAAAADGLNDLTLAFWLQTTQSSGLKAIVSGANSANDNELSVYWLSGTTLRFHTGETTSSFVDWSVPLLKDGSWHHIALVRNAAADQVTLYIDGVSQGLRSTILNPVTIDPSGFVLGQEQDLVGGGFDPNQALGGALDEVYLYSRLLSAAEIADLASPAGSDSTPPSAPTDLAATVNGTSIDLAWTAAADPESGVASYRVYRDTQTGTAKALLAEVPGTQTTFGDVTVPGVDYFYEVAAVNGQGLEGPRSNEASASGGPALAGHWALDDGSGLIATDASGNGYDGTLVNGPAWRGGRVGGALSFDGNDDRVDLPAASADGLNDLTLAFWLQTTQSSGLAAIVSGANSTNDNELSAFWLNGTTLRFHTGETTGSYVDWSVPSLKDGSWHHLALVRAASLNQVTLYVDGASQGARSTTLNPVSVSTNGFVLGQEQDVVGGGYDPAQALGGAVDEVYLYGRLLSASEIAGLASPAIDSTPPSSPTLSANVNGTTIDLTWTPASDSESGIGSYRIYRDTQSGTAKTLLAEVPPSQTTLADMAVPDVEYYYEVSAVNGQGFEGSRSNEVSASGGPALAGYWALDDGSGVTATDSSTYGYDGTLVNGPTWSAGRVGGALSFDGNNDRVDLPAASANGLADLTLAFWLQTTQTSGLKAIVSGANSTNDNELSLFWLNGTTLRFHTGETTTSYVDWSVPVLADGKWHHVALARNAAANQATLNVDGISQGTQSTLLNPVTIDAGGLVLGQEQDTVGGGFDPNQALGGALDEVYLYAKLLSPSEISDLANVPDETPPSAPSGLGASVAGNDVTLSWAPAADPESGIAAYRVYRDTVSGGAKAQIAEVPGTETTYVDTPPDIGTTYYYEVAAVNGDDLEGARSNEADTGTPAGPIAHWTFDDGSGLTASDSSGNGYDGTLVNGPRWGAGRLGGGLIFDGYNDRVDLPAAALDGQDDLTISFWIRTRELYAQGYLSAANASNDNELLIFQATRRVINFNTGETPGSSISWTVPNLANNAWHHIVVARNASANQVTLYVDGVSIGTISTPLSPLQVDAGGLVLGQEQDTLGGGFDWTQAFSGTMDDLQIYDRILSPAEIAVLAGGG